MFMYYYRKRGAGGLPLKLRSKEESLGYTLCFVRSVVVVVVVFIVLKWIKFKILLSLRERVL